jgi:hypothetical protein
MRHTIAALALTALVALGAGCDSPEKTYYAIESAGVTLGYLELWTEAGDSAAGDPIVDKGRMVNRLSLMGQGMDAIVLGEERIDPATNEIFHIESRVTTGPTTIVATCEFSGDTLRYSMSAEGKARTDVLDPDVIRGRSTDFSFLKDLEPGDDAVTRRFLAPFMGNIHTKTFTPVRQDTLFVAGAAYDCIVFDTFNQTNGVASQFWIDRNSGVMIREASADGTAITLTDAGVRGRVQRLNMDDTVFASVDPLIEGVRSITSMRVRATVRVVGQLVSVQSLNVPGQRFDGTVDANLVEGEFTIAYPRYDGEGAPPFPPDVPTELERYLRPSFAIESDDPAIIEKAVELTAGATDSWDAATRIATFVATEIEGALPGGGTALKTLQIRKAECGGHSRLVAALCRAVGIPARMATGCTYTAVKDGSFGQHGWNEIYMGEAGWIPIDATFGEVDYVDSGHIRFGTLTSFRPVAMEVLDYTVGPPVPDPREP